GVETPGDGAEGGRQDTDPPAPSHEPASSEPTSSETAAAPFVPIPDSALPRAPAGPAPQARPARLTPAEALVRLREASTRDEVIGAAIAFVRGAFQFVALYTRQGTSMVVFEA